MEALIYFSVFKEANIRNYLKREFEKSFYKPKMTNSE